MVFCSIGNLTWFEALVLVFPRDCRVQLFLRPETRRGGRVLVSDVSSRGPVLLPWRTEANPRYPRGGGPGCSSGGAEPSRSQGKPAASWLNCYYFDWTREVFIESLPIFSIAPQRSWLNLKNQYCTSCSVVDPDSGPVGCALYGQIRVQGSKNKGGRKFFCWHFLLIYSLSSNIII